MVKPSLKSYSPLTNVQTDVLYNYIAPASLPIKTERYSQHPNIFPPVHEEKTTAKTQGGQICVIDDDREAESKVKTKSRLYLHRNTHAVLL